MAATPKTSPTALAAETSEFVIVNDSGQGPERLAQLLAFADEIVEDYYDYINNAGERARELVRKYRALRYYGELAE